MNATRVKIMFSFLAILGLALPARTESQASGIVGPGEALTVARNWVTVILHYSGNWGGSETAEVTGIQEFKGGARLLGYLCPVKPQGFVLVSLRHELAPVKAYSAGSNLDPKSDGSMAGLIKGRMELLLSTREEQVGPLAAARRADLEGILEINYRSSWEELGHDGTAFKDGLASGTGPDFQESGVLLSSSWGQGDPYNRFCPAGHTGSRTLVGCVGTAAAQIMNYWSWPPSGVGSHAYAWSGDESCSGYACGKTLSATFGDPYDWPHMADQYVANGAGGWQDENGDPLTQEQIDAVAELSHEVGVAVEMQYGVDISGVSPSHMEDVYEDHFRYARDIVERDRKDHSATEWFNRMKDQFRTNRPVQYTVLGHSMVADGWREFGSIPMRQVHLNPGWGPDAVCGGYACHLWYTLDAMTVGEPGHETMLENIYPAPALGAWLSGRYRTPSFAYRYFDRDATGHDARFDAGQTLQFLPGVTVGCTSSRGGRIGFDGLNTANTYLFTRGDPSTGIRIHSGHIHLLKNGRLTFH